jgi:hypothetical protein
MAKDDSESQVVDRAYQISQLLLSKRNFDDPGQRIDAARAVEAEQKNKLRIILFSVVLLLLIIVELSAVLTFWHYMAYGVHWNPPAATLNIWLSVTVVQVVGLVAVIVRYLFPPGSSRN